MKYRKKPVVIEAFRIGIDPIPDWFMDNVLDQKIILRTDAPEDVHIEQRKEFKTWCEIETLEGVMNGNYSDYIIKGVKDEIYPCKADIFEMTYTSVEKFEQKHLIELRSWNNCSLGCCFDDIKIRLVINGEVIDHDFWEEQEYLMRILKALNITEYEIWEGDAE